MTHHRGLSLAAAWIGAALLGACATAPAPTTTPAAPAAPQPSVQAPQAATPPLREYSYRQPEDPAGVESRRGNRPENRIVLIPPADLPDPRPPEAEDRVTATYTGLASWYGRRFHGRRTASGERYDMAALTAAHKTLPFGSRVRVTNLDNGRSVVVIINDRGPFVKRRVIDLSRAAAERLGFINHGLAKVRVDVLDEPAS